MSSKMGEHPTTHAFLKRGIHIQSNDFIKVFFMSVGSMKHSTVLGLGYIMVFTL